MSHDPGTTARSKNLGFVTLFLVEMWERFGYYGMTAVIVLFMVQRLAYSDDRANLTFGAFTALAYAIPAAGGYIGDKLPGRNRTLVLGALGLVLLGIAVATLCVTFIIQNREVARGIVALAFVVMVVIFGLMMRRGSERERKGLWAVIILTAEAMLFFIFYQQMSTSLTLFSLRNVDLDLFGYQVPAGQVQALNPIWIFILSPPLAWLYNRLGKKGEDFHISTKFAMGFAILSLGFFLYGISGRFAENGKVSFSWMVAGYAFQSLGELLISGLGLAVVARYVAPSLRGFLMGVYFLSTGLSQYLGSFVATYASVPEGVTSPVQSLPLYTSLFIKLGFVAVIGTVLAAALIPLMKRLPEAGTIEAHAG